MSEARTVSILLGDVDGGINNGVGSVDDVYIDPDWLALHANTPVQFDLRFPNTVVPFTFLWDMQPGEIVIDAVLTVAIQGADSKVSTDNVRLESILNVDKYDYSALGWTPIPTSQVVVRSMNLATALGRNLLPQLQDGQLNGNLGDDTMIDYAQLDLTIVPFGDLDGEGYVGLIDLDIVLLSWNMSAPLGDVRADPTGDGYVGLEDLDLVLNNWNAGTPPTLESITTMPEPSALAVFTIGCLANLKRSSKKQLLL